MAAKRQRTVQCTSLHVLLLANRWDEFVSSLVSGLCSSAFSCRSEGTVAQRIMAPFILYHAPSLSDKLGVERAGSAEAEHRAKARGGSVLAPWPAATKLRGRESRRAGNVGRTAPRTLACPPGSRPEIKGSARGGAGRGRCVHCMPTWEGLLRWDLHLGVVDRVGCYSQAQLALAVKQALSLMEHRTTTPSRSCVPVPASRCHARFGRASRPANRHRGGERAGFTYARHGTPIGTSPGRWGR
jgi:hypothetical protein